MIASIFNNDPSTAITFGIIGMFWLIILIAYNETK